MCIVHVRIYSEFIHFVKNRDGSVVQRELRAGSASTLCLLLVYLESFREEFVVIRKSHLCCT